MKREWLRDLRKSHAVTLKELGEALYYSESVMCNIENGRRKTKGLDVIALKRIADYIGVDFTVCAKAEEAWLREAGLWRG